MGLVVWLAGLAALRGGQARQPDHQPPLGEGQAAA